MKFIKNKYYYVLWEDHCSDQLNWTHTPGHDMAPVIVETVGFVTKDEPKYVTIGMNKDANGTVCGQMTILKSCIKKKKQINI